MGRKTKPKSRHISIRLPESIAIAVDGISCRTGWSDSKSLAWLAAAGDRIVRDPKFDGGQARLELNAHADRHAAEEKAAAINREAAANLRRALSNGHAPAAAKPKSELTAALAHAKGKKGA